MQIHQKTNGRITIVLLDGRLDASSAPALRRALRDAVDAGSPGLVLDFARVSFVDSSGLSVLVTALRHARESGGDVALVRIGDQMRLLLELTRLHTVFLVADDDSSAMSAMSA